MSVNDFIKLREKDWERLQVLLRHHKGRNPLTADEVRELGQLYRAVTSDLALARRDYPGQRVTAYLNQLLTQAHNLIYQREVSDFRRLIYFITHRLPQTFRETWVFTLVAFLLFIVPGIVGYRLAVVNPDVADTLGLSEVRQTLVNNEIWTNIPIEQRPYASAFIMGNNIRVALLAFGGGITFGLFSVYILMINGLIIGGVLGLAAHYGLGGALTEFVIAHGVVELSVIFIAGGAGLQLGWALLNPGLYSRRDALGIAAKRAIVLVLAAIPLLVFAGLIEGFISPSDSDIGLWGRVLVAVGSGAALYGYLLLAGREHPQKPVRRLRMRPDVA